MDDTTNVAYYPGPNGSDPFWHHPQPLPVGPILTPQAPAISEQFKYINDILTASNQYKKPSYPLSRVNDRFQRAANGEHFKNINEISTANKQYKKPSYQQSRVNDRFKVNPAASASCGRSKTKKRFRLIQKVHLVPKATESRTILARFYEYINDGRFSEGIQHKFELEYFQLIASAHQFTQFLRKGTAKEKYAMVNAHAIMTGLMDCFPPQSLTPIAYPVAVKAAYNWLDIHGFESHVKGNAEMVQANVNHNTLLTLFISWYLQRIVRSVAGHVYWRIKAGQVDIINNYDIFGTIVPHTKYNEDFGYDAAIYFALHKLHNGIAETERIEPARGDDNQTPEYSTESESSYFANQIISEDVKHPIAECKRESDDDDIETASTCTYNSPQTHTSF